MFLAACSDEKKVTIGLHDSEAAKNTLRQLESEDIWYKSESEGRFTFIASDLNRVVEIHKSSTEQIIPFDRSASFGDELHNIVIRNLRNEKIPYRVKTYDGSKWIIWEKANEYQFRKVEIESTKEFLKTLDSRLIDDNETYNN